MPLRHLRARRIEFGHPSLTPGGMSPVYPHHVEARPRPMSGTHLLAVPRASSGYESTHLLPDGIAAVARHLRAPRSQVAQLAAARTNRAVQTLVSPHLLSRAS